MLFYKKSDNIQSESGMNMFEQKSRVGTINNNTKCYLSKSTPIDRRIYNINSWYPKYPYGKIEFITI